MVIRHRLRRAIAAVLGLAVVGLGIGVVSLLWSSRPAGALLPEARAPLASTPAGDVLLRRRRGPRGWPPHRVAGSWSRCCCSSVEVRPPPTPLPRRRSRPRATSWRSSRCRSTWRFSASTQQHQVVADSQGVAAWASEAFRFVARWRPSSSTEVRDDQWPGPIEHPPAAASITTTRYHVVDGSGTSTMVPPPPPAREVLAQLRPSRRRRTYWMATPPPTDQLVCRL